MKLLQYICVAALLSAAGCQVTASYFAKDDDAFDKDFGWSSPRRPSSAKDVRKAKELSEIPDERPGYRKTFVGALADLGFGLTGTPALYLIGMPIMCMDPDSDDMADVAQGVMYPFGLVGAAAFAGPAVILKFVFYDAPAGVVWLFKSDKGKVAYYINHISDLDESEYDHLVELTGVNKGDVSRHKNMLYSWGIADKEACRRWRAWWSESRSRSKVEGQRSNVNK